MLLMSGWLLDVALARAEDLLHLAELCAVARGLPFGQPFEDPGVARIPRRMRGLFTVDHAAGQAAGQPTESQVAQN